MNEVQPKADPQESQASPTWFPSLSLEAFPSLDSTTETSSHPHALAGHGHLTLYCAGCGHSHVVSLRCGDRCCPCCRGKDYTRFVHGYLESIKAITRPKLLTLTVRNWDTLTPDRLRWVLRCQTRLFRQKYYREHAKGGLRCVEVTCSEKGWHPHLHVVLDADYIPQAKLSKDWAKITGGSGIVDIRAAGTVGDALKYCLKYLTKPPRLKGKEEVITDEELEERREVYRAAVHGVRLVQPFGSLYDKLVLELPDMRCERCGGHRFIVWEFELQAEWHRFCDGRGQAGARAGPGDT